MRQLLSFALFCVTLGQALLGQSPRIDSIDPAQGPIAGGTVVTITGANFQGATLSVDKVAATPQAISATAIRFTSGPHDNGIASIKVATTAGAAYGEFLYVPPRLQDLPPGYITTVAGIGTFTGFYRPATQAEIHLMGSPAFDQSGNLYIPEPGRHRVSRVRPDGIIEPFAGTGIGSFIGERPDVGASGPATEIALNFPRGVTTDSSGYVYFTDYDSRLHRVDTRTGILTTIAGNGTAGFSGDGGPAVRAQLTDSTHITGDGNGTLFFIDFDDAAGFGRIRKITPDGTISTVAGVGPSGFSGDGGPATQAQFNLIYGDRGSLALDSNGNLFIADPGNSRIRRIDGRTGIITTARYHESASAWVYLAADRAGNIYFNEDLQILKMGPTGQIIDTYGSTHSPVPYLPPIDGTPINSATFLVHGLAIDPAGNIVYMETNRARRLNLSTGLLETLAGIGLGIIGDNGPAIASTLAISNADIAVLPSGELLIGDGGHGVVRKLDGNGDISVFANGNDPRIHPNFIGLTCAIEPDGTGNVYLSDTYNIFRIDAKGVVSLLAGKQNPWVFGYSGDGGLATDALLCQPWGVALDGAGNVFIADTNNNRIRRIDAQTGIITTVAGSGPVNGFEHYEGNGQGSFSGDGGSALQACLNTPYDVAVDSKGNLFIGDGGNRRIRKVDTNGIISTFVANVYVTKLVFDHAGNLFGATDDRIFRFDPEGRSTQIAGMWPPGFSGDGGPALQAQARAMSQSTGIAIDAEGNVFFLDGGNFRVRAIRYGALLAPPAITRQPVAPRVTAGQPAIFAVAATGFPAPSYQWKKDGVDISGATDATYTIASTQVSQAGNYTVAITNMIGSATSSFAKLTVVTEPTAPGIAAPPASQTITAGDGATFSVLINGSALLSYQWRKDGAAVSGATSAALSLPSVTVGDAGNYTVVITNSAGRIESGAAVLTVTVPNTGRLINLSVLTSIASGENFTVGTVLGGAGTSGTKPLLVRAVGPTLGTAPFNLSGVLADPKLDLFSGQTTVASNDDWGGGAAMVAANAQVGAFPFASAASKEAALVYSANASAPPASFTMQISGSAGTAGLVLAEIYDSTPAAAFTTKTPRLINVSVLKPIGTGLTAGFVIGGATPLKVLIRVIGPSLSLFSVSGAIADPKLELFDSASKSIATNDDWGGTAALTAAFDQVGAFLLGATTKDAALLATLNPGNYTVQATPATGVSGTGLVEVYEVP